MDDEPAPRSDVLAFLAGELGKAVGLLMAFHKVSDTEAFQMLRKTSQDLKIKVAEVARELIDYHRDR